MRVRHGNQRGVVLGPKIVVPPAPKGTRTPEKYLAGCKGCIYLGHNSRTCDFYLMTGQRRGCPAGEDCTRRREKHRPGMKLDPDMAKKLYRLNYGDELIAEKLGCRVDTVARWRMANNLPPGPKKKKMP